MTASGVMFKGNGATGAHKIKGKHQQCKKRDLPSHLQQQFGAGEQVGGALQLLLYVVMLSARRRWSWTHLWISKKGNMGQNEKH